MTTTNDERRPVIAISSCLLGQQVRFNRGHKRDNWLSNELGHHFIRNPDPYIADQWYLLPYSDELGLKNTM